MIMIIIVLFVSVLHYRSAGPWINGCTVSFTWQRDFSKQNLDFSHNEERESECAQCCSLEHKWKHKGITGPKERRRYLRKNIEAEFAANPWSNVSALQKMDKKTRSLEKSCGNESWSKVRKRGPNTSKVFIKVTKTWRNSSLWRKLRN